MASFWLRGIKCVIYRLSFLVVMMSKLTFSAWGISVVQVQTPYHVKKLKNGNCWLFLCNIWSRYLQKLQFMHTETHQISNLGSQDVFKEILSDLVKKDVAEFNDKFYHFEYATLEMFKGHSIIIQSWNVFFINTYTLQFIVKTSPINIMQQFRTKNHMFYSRIAPKWGRSMSIFFYLPQFLLLRNHFFLSNIKVNGILFPLGDK